MTMSTHGGGPGFGPGFGGEPVSGGIAKDLSSHWNKEMESLFCTSPYPLGVGVWFSLHLLYWAARIDCAIYYASGIGDYVLGVVCSPI